MIKALFPVFFIIFGFKIIEAQEILKDYKLIKRGSFFQKDDPVNNNNNIQWYNFIVPEEWDSPKKKITLAVAIIPSLNTNSKKYITYIPGGPAGVNISRMKTWITHPARKEANIILMDMRGSGFSQPSLCPDAWKKLLEIMAEDNTPNDELREITNLSKSCNQELNIKDIDLKSYSTKNILKDLKALKNSLAIQKWFVYGVSYGTHIALSFTIKYPDDCDGTILDSPISDIYQYYNNNTRGYIESLNKVFKNAKTNYPKLNEQYNHVISELNVKPTVVNVDKDLIPSGIFTYNKEDFKVLIQQSLYSKQSIELLPFIIKAFYKKDQKILRNLTTAFSGRLRRDLGTYYCITCNDLYSNNSVDEFNNSAKNGGDTDNSILLYKSDLMVCNELGLKNIKEDTSLINLPIKSKGLIFVGEYDPITPPSNGQQVTNFFEDAYLYEIPYGHGNSFSVASKDVVSQFIKNTNERPQMIPEEPIKFQKQIFRSPGILRILTSISKGNYLLLSPLFIALGVFIISLFYNLKKGGNVDLRYLRILTIVLSILSLILITGFAYAIYETSVQDYFIIPFGLPEKWRFLFYIIYFYIILIVLYLLLLLIYRKRIDNIEIKMSILFSYSLLVVYFLYWHVI